MNSKERILKMLEEGKITSEEAIRLMETMDKKEYGSQSAGEEEKKGSHRADDEEEYWDGGMFNDLYKQFMGEVNKYVKSDKYNEKYRDVNERANKTYKDVRSRFDSSQQA